MENQFSKIILGTVQLGMPYGLGQWADELMPEKEAFKILDAAWERGITTVDTSRDYGLSEERIVKYMKMNSAKYFHVISKIKDFDFELYENDGGLEVWMLRCPFLTLKNCASLTILLHKEKLIENPRVRDALSDAVQKETIAQWGVSLYRQDTAICASNIYDCKIIQLPFGPLNQSFVSSGVANKLSIAGKSVIARSILAQGRLIRLTDNESYDISARDLLIEELRDALLDGGISVVDFSINMALSAPDIDNIVLGADNLENVSSWFNRDINASLGKLPASLLDKLSRYDGVLGKPQCW